MRLLVLIAALVCVAAARAQERLVSVDAFDLGYTGGLLFKSQKGASSHDGRDSNDFRLRLNYAQNLEGHEGLMWKAVTHINRVHDNVGDDTTNSTWGLTGGVLYNFDAADIKNSGFVGFQAGLEWQHIEDGVDDESGMNFLSAIEGGKRWDMGRYAMAAISYAPTIELGYRRYGGGIHDNIYKSGTELKLSFLKFDVMF